jgi:hypothetical protein
MKNLLLALWFCIASLLCAEALKINENVLFKPKTADEILQSLSPNQFLQESDMERLFSSGRAQSISSLFVFSNLILLL